MKFDGSPDRARPLLTAWFQRAFRWQHARYPGQRSGHRVDPSLVLTALEDCDIEDPRAAASVEAIYDQGRQGRSDVPPFADIVERNIVRVAWGSAHWPHDLLRVVERDRGQPIADALTKVVELPFGPHANLGQGAKAALARAEDELATAVLRAAEPSDRCRALRSWAEAALAPGWIAARLWERARGRPDALRWWDDRCCLLGLHGVVDDHWPPHQLDELSGAIIERLRAEPDLTSWDAEWHRLQTTAALQEGLWPPESPSCSWRRPPNDIEGRLEWVEEVEAGGHNHLYRGRDRIFGLVGVLARCVELGVSSSAPHPRFAELIELAADRPALWVALGWQVLDRPGVLAEALFCDRSFAWALDRLARLGPRGLPDDPEVATGAFAEQVARAFECAIGIGLHTALVDPSRGAAPFAWVVSRLATTHRFGDDRALFAKMERARAALWSEVHGASLDNATQIRRLLACMLGHTRLALNAGGNESWLRASLEIVEQGGSYLDPEGLAEASRTIADAYLERLRSEDSPLEPEALTPKLAATLVRMVLRFEGSHKERFWEEALLGPSECERPTARPRLGRDGRVRAHLRLLARAVRGWPADERPAELVDLVVRAVAEAVRQDPAAGVAPLLMPSWRDRDAATIAEELGRCINILPGADRRRVLGCLAKAPDARPLALVGAQLHGVDRDHLLGVALEVAGQPAVQKAHRTREYIEALADAGLAAEAARLLREEQQSARRAPASGHELWRLKMRLRLALVETPAEILTATIPSGLAPNEREEADRIVAFYQGLAHFQGGDLDRAERLFERLSGQFPDVSAYLVNLHATRVARVLPPDHERSVDAEQRRAIERLLLEGDELLGGFRAWLREQEDVTFEGNRILLRFALGQFEVALNDLRSLGPLVDSSERLSSYEVIALARLGRGLVAKSRFEDALRRFGEGEALRSARAVLRGSSAHLQPGVEEELRPVRVRRALADLKSLLPHEQAVACGHDSLHGMVVDQVRESSRALRDLVPFLARRNGNSPDTSAPPLEDPTTELFRRLLEHRTARWLGWSWHGQEPGGFSAGSRFGESDMVLKKDGAPLAVFEAVRVVGRSDRTKIRRHFTKLFGYAPSGLKFLLVWCFGRDPKVILDDVRLIASRDAPVGHACIEVRELSLVQGDAGPPALISEHENFGSPIHVVHIVVDLERHDDRAAAVAGRP